MCAVTPRLGNDVHGSVEMIMFYGARFTARQLPGLKETGIDSPSPFRRDGSLAVFDDTSGGLRHVQVSDAATVQGREFAAGRACAHRALEVRGISDYALL